MQRENHFALHDQQVQRVLHLFMRANLQREGYVEIQGCIWLIMI